MTKPWNTNIKCAKFLIVMYFIAVMFCIYTFNASNSSANGEKKSPTNSNKITEDSVNLTVAVFIKSFMSDLQSERQNALIYLLGVLDATEGKSWCGYHILKTISIREYIYEYLKKLPRHRYDERASKVIEEAMHEAFSCRG